MASDHCWYINAVIYILPATQISGMTTLELLYDRSTFQLWSWTTHGAGSGNQHISIHVQQCIQNMTFLATMGPLGVSPTIHVVVKVAFGEEDVAVLDLEAELYRSQLGPLQGYIVPKCYGYFQCGSSVSCLVLELCNHVINHSICGLVSTNLPAYLTCSR